MKYLGCLGILVLVWLSTATSLMAQNQYQDLDYSQQIGYLSPSNPDISTNFKRCSNRPPIGTYSSANPYIFRESKGAFRKYILTHFDNTAYDDNGLLNLRFIVNCRGELGDVEVNELNNDFERTDLSDALVDQLKSLALQPKHWRGSQDENPIDFYMYLIFRIQNGAVVEILP
ncbi:MAG: hypothetical protein AAGF77_04560 [Bacteroidota bacterium]